MLDRSTILEHLRGLLADMFEIEPQRITPAARLSEDLDIDSIDAIDLLLRLKEMTGQRIPAEAFKRVRTVADVIAVLQPLLPADRVAAASQGSPPT